MRRGLERLSQPIVGRGRRVETRRSTDEVSPRLRPTALAADGFEALLAMWISSATPTPQEASARPVTPSSVSTLTRTQETLVIFTRSSCKTAPAFGVRLTTVGAATRGRLSTGILR